MQRQVSPTRRSDKRHKCVLNAPPFRVCHFLCLYLWSIYTWTKVVIWAGSSMPHIEKEAPAGSLHIRRDPNKLYNYMIQMALLKHVAQYDEVNLIRDNRTVKVASGNSLIDYLQTYMWFELKASTALFDVPLDSKSTRKLIFIDWMNNIIWGRYEDENNRAYNILKPHLRERKLFFRKKAGC